MVKQIIAGTILLIVIYYVFTNSEASKTIIKSIGDNYVRAVKALQGQGK